MLYLNLKVRFQSTLSARRATYIYIRHQLLLQISIHALREESDGNYVVVCTCPFAFQSTLSARRATSSFKSSKTSRLISIHALREESDQTYHLFIQKLIKFQSTLSARRATLCFLRKAFYIFYFNPRSPRGERL